MMLPLTVTLQVTYALKCRLMTLISNREGEGNAQKP